MEGCENENKIVGGRIFYEIEKSLHGGVSKNWKSVYSDPLPHFLSGNK